MAGVSTLRLLAAGAARPSVTTWAVLDARRGLVYAAPFRLAEGGGGAEGGEGGEGGAGSLERLDEDAALGPERLSGLIQGPALLVGEGARAYAAELAGPGRELAPAWADVPRPGLLALVGHERLVRGGGLPPEQVRPRYCRPSDAEIRFGLPLDEYRLLE